MRFDQLGKMNSGKVRKLTGKRASAICSQKVIKYAEMRTDPTASTIAGKFFLLGEVGKATLWGYAKIARYER